MTAVDTHIVVRLIARDDPVQLQRARALFAECVCFIPDTVLLEAAWVLRSSYGALPGQIHAELLAVLGLPNVRVADPARVQQAPDGYAGRLDFADAMHLAAARQTAAFATFDQRFIRRAAGKGACPVQEP